MKRGWTRKALGEICGFVRGPFGGSLKKEVFVSDGYAVYEQKHAISNQFEDIRYFIDDAKFQEMKRFELLPNDIIMSCSGTMGKVAIVPESIRQGIINQALLKLTPSNNVAPEFLKYWMDSSDFQESLKGQCGGVAIQNVASVGILKKIQIPLPSLPEQKHIVAILDEAFAGITRAIANTEKNLANARELFECYLNNVFTQRGEGWVDKKLGDVIQITHGFAFKGSSFKVSNDTSRPIVLTPGNYTENATLYFNEKNTKRLFIETPHGFEFDEGDLTIVMTDLSSKMKILGKPAFIENTGILHNQRIGRIFFNDNSISKRYLYYYLQSREVSNAIKATATGTMVRHTAPKRILSNKVSFPLKRKHQDNIVNKLNILMKETQHLEAIYQKKLTALAELKQSILQKAFTGELTADTVEQ